MVATALIVAVFAALAILFAYDRRLAAIFVASAAVIFVALRLLAMLDHGAGAPPAAPALDAAAARHRQYPPARAP